MSYDVYHRNVDGAGFTGASFETLSAAIARAEELQARSDARAWPLGENAAGGFVFNPYRYEYVVFGPGDRRAYETRSAAPRGVFTADELERRFLSEVRSA